MKIEKINDNQIKCILSRTDLLNFQLQISELAYGTDHAKALFQELLEEAFDKYGFEADDMPLMIEAVPMPPDCVVLLVTKIHSTDELSDDCLRNSDDFSCDEQDFSQEWNNEEDSSSDLYSNLDRLFPLLDDFAEQMNPQESSNESLSKDSPSKDSPSAPKTQEILCIYDFPDFDYLLKACHALSGLSMIQKSSVYKASDYQVYYLILHIIGTEKDYNKITGIVTEFGEECTNAAYIEAYLSEHKTTLLADHAIEQLCTLDK